MSHSICRHPPRRRGGRRRRPGARTQRLRKLPIRRVARRQTSPPSSRASTTRSSRRWSRASTTQATADGVEVDGPGRQLDHRHHRPGRQARRPCRAGLQLLHRQSDHGHQPDPGPRAARRPRTSRSSTSTARSTPMPPRPPTPRSRPTSAPTTPTPARRPPPRWANCCPAAERSRSSAASPVTSPAPPGSTASPRQCRANAQDHLDRGRRLGTPDGADQGDRHHDAPTRTSTASSSPTTTWALGVAQAIANAGQDRPDQGHQRRRQQGRVRGGQGRRHRRRGRAVPVRDRRDGRRGLQGRRRRKTLPDDVKAPVAGRHQGNVDAALASAPSPRAVREPVRGARQVTSRPSAAATRDDDARQGAEATPALAAPCWIPPTWPPGPRRSRLSSWRSSSRRSTRRS